MRRVPVIAVLRASAADRYDAVVDVLVENGIRSIELTLTTPGTIEHLPALCARVGDAAEIGVGTVTTGDQARRAIGAGAAYLVTPVVRTDVIEAAAAARVAVLVGGLTPTELFTAWEAGATAVKVFPAQTVGARFGSHLRGPFPDIEFVPSGGVGLDDVGDWLGAGALAVSLGGPLVGDALSGGSLPALAGRARTAVALAEAAR
ncbi:2-dehydro-3-deoxyphosphogluconate aldolase [Microbacterium sp. SYP-A9085]|nr:bifunctional 4-hydroxy-2-oxoglutarate aldolase/2-dehydro-3-deoxy-phosphogluconate aldolase [Microbacterium sp. SYP-A9085]MRH28304.1 2-dehydro-3-deoxyphosphogluconate aldolase [Microbacterium sp. SYP-A9085]